MDYRKFLNRTEVEVLPFLGGASVDAAERRLRVAPCDGLAPGWWRFEIEGRRARAIEPAEPPDLGALPVVRGHLAGEWLFASGGMERVELLPADEPPILSPIRARRWYGGELLFEALDFEQQAEEDVRRALEDGTAIANLKGVAASLRAAFGWALTAQVAGRRGVPLSPYEVRDRLREIADTGGAEAVVVAIEAARRAEADRRARAALVAEVRERVANRRARADRRSAQERATDAIEKAGATLLSTRNAAEGLLEVTYRFMGQRFVSLVRPDTLGVVDAGICLQGHDPDLTLESLPSAIREAIDEGILHITRW